MAINRDILEREIKNALVNAGTLWANVQKEVLQELTTNDTKLHGAPPMFQAAAYLNLGLSATKTLFPNSAFAETVAKMSIPIAVVNYAMDAFRNKHNSDDDRTKALLRHEYSSLKDDFEGEITQIMKDLVNKPFAVKVRAEMFGVLSKRMTEFSDDGMAYSHCINMITHSQHGVIETDRAAIRKRSAEGFLTLCNKIYDVYRGVYGTGALGGLNSLTRVNPDKQVCYAETGRGPLTRGPQTDPFTKQTAACGPEFDLVAVGDTVKREAEMKRILGEIGKYDVMYLSAWLQNHVYVRPSRLVMEVDGHTSSYAKSDLSGIRGSLENADRVEWPRTLRVRAGGV